jgi:ribonuclease P protein component
MTPAHVPDGGFPRAARLLVPADFKTCFGAGQRLGARYFRVHYVFAERPRLGLAVSRKVDRRAVVRNRLKRTARDSFRLARGGLPPVDIVLLARLEAAKASPAELRADLASLWRRVAALKPPGQEGTMRADTSTAASGVIDPPPTVPTAAATPGASRPTE